MRISDNSLDQTNLVHNSLEYKIPDLLLYSVESMESINSTESTESEFSSKYYYRVSMELKKSIFITSIGHVCTANAAKSFINTIRKEFPDANHNCWAYALAAPGDTAQVGQSDNGEPHGTAGKPMLGILLHRDVGEIVVVVTRYFGGIKLGTGGLVRAYQSSVDLAIQSLPVCIKRILCKITVSIPYKYVSKIYHLLPKYEACILEENSSEQASYLIQVPDSQLVELHEALQNATDGQATITSKL